VEGAALPRPRPRLVLLEGGHGAPRRLVVEALEGRGLALGLLRGGVARGKLLGEVPALALEGLDAGLCGERDGGRGWGKGTG
jgi:hypothetical protein